MCVLCSLMSLQPRTADSLRGFVGPGERSDARSGAGSLRPPGRRITRGRRLRPVDVDVDRGEDVELHVLVGRAEDEVAVVPRGSGHAGAVPDGQSALGEDLRDVEAAAGDRPLLDAGPTRPRGGSSSSARRRTPRRACSCRTWRRRSPSTWNEKPGCDEPLVLTSKTSPESSSLRPEYQELVHVVAEPEAGSRARRCCGPCRRR